MSGSGKMDGRFPHYENCINLKIPCSNFCLYPKSKALEVESEIAGKIVFAQYVRCSIENELANPLHQALEVDMASLLSQIVNEEGAVHHQILIW